MMVTKPRFYQRRWLRVTAAVVFFTLVAAIAALPTIVSQTSLRNTLVNRALDDPNLHATVEKASFGWTSSGSLSELDVVKQDDSFHLNIEGVRIERSLLGLLFSLPDIGLIEIDRPHLELQHTPGAGLPSWEDIKSIAARRDHANATFAAAVRDARIVIQSPAAEQPVLDVDGLTLDLALERTQAGRQFRVEPAVVLDHQQLTPQLCNQGLHLVAPILAKSTNTSGELSVQIDEFQVPVGQQGEGREPRRITGVVTLHNVESNLKNPILRQTATLVGGLLKFPVPNTVRVLQDSHVKFDVRDEGVYHDGMAFVLPEISDELVIRTNGFVGVDRSLDLEIVATLPSQLAAETPVLEKLTDRPLELVVRGTIDEPQIAFADGQDALDELVSRLSGDKQPQPAKPLGWAITELVTGLASQKKGEKPDKKEIEATTKDILNIIRSARDQKKDKKDETRTR